MGSQPWRPLPCVLAAVAVAVAAACGSSQTGPTPVVSGQAPLPPAESPAITRVTVVSGWDDAPVAGARVQVNGKAMVTDGGGTISDTADMRGAAIDIEAAGFLVRRTRVDRPMLRLWPAADERSAQAIRQLAYSREFTEQDTLRQIAARAFISVPPDLPGLADRFREAVADANEIMVAETYSMDERDYYFEGQTWAIVQVADADCPFGICLPAPHLRGDPDLRARLEVPVTKAALAQPQTPLRLLVMAQFVGTNPLPGMLNPRTPEITYPSLLERQALRLLLQRRPCTIWPDDDRTNPCDL